MSRAELEEASGLFKLSCETHTHAADGCIDHVLCSLSKSDLQRAAEGQGHDLQLSCDVEVTASDHSMVVVDLDLGPTTPTTMNS